MIEVDFTALVTEFHEKIGAHIGKGIIIQPPVNVRLLRMRLMGEELGETIVAIHEQNMEQTADGLTDLLYVIVGTGISYGCPVTRDMFATWPVARMNPHPEIVSYHIAQMSARIAELFLGMEDKYLSGVPRAVQAAATAVFNTGLRCFGYPMEKLFVEVHRSNMTKNGMNKFDKGGKGDAWQPPQIIPTIEQAWQASLNPLSASDR